MKPGRISCWFAPVLTTLAIASHPRPVVGGQENLQPLVNPPTPALRFDWLIIRIGTATYEEGPTGVTVIQFARKVCSAIDDRGRLVINPGHWQQIGTRNSQSVGM